MADPTPHIGDLKPFPGHKVGQWDGHGWEDVTDEQPVAPGFFEAPAAPAHGRSVGATAAEDYGLPMAGAVIGGKTPLGPIGSGIGAAVGQGYGDLMHYLGNAATNTPDTAPPPTMGEEAKKLSATAGLTALGEKVIPPVLKAIPSFKGVWRGLPLLGGLTEMGLGHPVVGGAMLASEAAAPLGRAVEWIGSPAGTSAGRAAASDIASSLSPRMASTDAGKRLISEGGAQAQKQAAGAWGDTSMPTFQKALEGLKAVPGAIKSGWNAADAWMQKPFMEATQPAITRTLEKVTPTTPIGDIPDSIVRPTYARNPYRSWSADVEIPAEMGGGTTRASVPPPTVEESKGLSAMQQNQWGNFKRLHPGTTDADLNGWLQRIADSKNRPGVSETPAVSSLWDNLRNSFKP